MTKLIDFDAYTDGAKRTESHREPSTASLTNFMDALMLANLAAELLDLYKKDLFYGRGIDAAKREEILTHMANTINGAAGPNDLPTDPGVPNVNPRLLHAVIGKFTEAGEMIQALGEAIETGNLDIVNLAEEVGDDKWYDALLLDELKKLSGGSITIDRILQTNLDKLAARYPEKFEGRLAITRDLDTERAILERVAS
ncbi:hypothetical protein [Chromobacterium sp. ASV23]|uniref:hypothetical protein n=1 Tax=Chromobacterium sp. ASV23 TaxID=2795110 RepID=UPI0018EAB006|nr:hypothetical protein [Chromobacterium sp. ASV23]